MSYKKYKRGLNIVGSLDAPNKIIVFSEDLCVPFVFIPRAQKWNGALKVTKFKVW